MIPLILSAMGFAVHLGPMSPERRHVNRNSQLTHPPWCSPSARARRSISAGPGIMARPFRSAAKVAGGGHHSAEPSSGPAGRTLRKARVITAVAGEQTG